MSCYIVIDGNLTRDPSGGYGKDTGTAYTHLDIAVTDGVKTTTGQWIDGPATYYRVALFGKTAETPPTASSRVTRSSSPANTPPAPTPGSTHEIIADL